MSNEAYRDLVDYAYSLVNIVNERYLEGGNTIYKYLVLGIGNYLVEGRPGSGHNYQAIIDAIHEYNTDHPEAKADKGLEEGMLDLIHSVGNGALFRLAQKVMICVQYELKKEKEGSNSFELNYKLVLSELNKAVQKEYNRIKKEYEDIDNWIKDNNTFLQENYGISLLENS